MTCRRYPSGVLVGGDAVRQGHLRAELDPEYLSVTSQLGMEIKETGVKENFYLKNKTKTRNTVGSGNGS